MHARELIELAALASAHGPVLLRGAGRISDSSMGEYWVASKCRQDRWARSLRAFATPAADAAILARSSRASRVPAVSEEIITGEALTRVWTAVLCAHDWVHGNDLAEPVARSVLVGHLEARHRVLTLLVTEPSVDAQQAVRLNRLRRRTERWTDVLIGYLIGVSDVSQFAPHPDRAKDFAEDLSYQSRQPGGRFVWPLLLGSLRAAFRPLLGPASPNGDLNAQIAASILASFPPELFDSTGVFHSLWLMRLSSVTDDTQGMIDEVLAVEQPAEAGDGVISGRLSDRLRRFGDA